ncbi:class F sortase [Dactylosporangium sp. McL0621]|uniref:class F sortase n=1 Tax=Dactylosporangium sp. McL0621 TaxID=3415678 RepID=UPI003CF0DB81
MRIRLVAVAAVAVVGLGGCGSPSPGRPPSPPAGAASASSAASAGAASSAGVPAASSAGVPAASSAGVPAASSAGGPAAGPAGARAPELTRGPVLPAADPTRVAIPGLGVASGLMRLGTDASGAMEVPPDAGTVGWFTGAPAPGSLGPAVLAGHVDWHGAKGAFARLADLTAGDEIDVDRADGRRAVFVVTGVERHPKDAFPTGVVYGPIDHAGLRLITCGGEFDRSTGHYRDNVVVFADLRA